jgi:flagellar protein FlaF
MAVAELIGATVGVIILVLVAYILVGSTLSTAQTVAEAQKDLTLMDESRLRTDIVISSATIENGNILNFSVNNTGSETVSDFGHMDILMSNGTGNFEEYTYVKNFAGSPGTWTIVQFEPAASSVHPGELDPGETMWCNVVYPGDTPVWFQVTTGNGVYASAYIPPTP